MLYAVENDGFADLCVIGNILINVRITLFALILVYSVPIRPLARENKASGTESKAIFTEAKATSIINMAHINV